MKFTTTYHYVLLGVVIGLFFPFISYVLTLGEQGIQLDFQNIVALHKSSNLFYIIDLAPFVIGVLFAVIGKLNMEKSSYLISISDLERKLRSDDYDPAIKNSIWKIRRVYITVFTSMCTLMVLGIIYYNKSSNYTQRKLLEFTEINQKLNIDLNQEKFNELNEVISELHSQSSVVGYSILISSILVLGLVSFFLFGHFQIIMPSFTKIIKKTLEINIAKQLIQKQSEELKKYSIANNGSNTSMTLLNPKGMITWVNKAFESLFNLKFEDVEKTHLFEVLLRNNSQISRDEITEIILKDRYYQEVFQLDIQGKGKIWINYVIQPYFDDNDVKLGYYSLQTDITDLMQTKTENEELLKHMQQNMDSAKFIQKSINHSEEEMKEFFENNVLIDLPLQVLSGDFLWFKKISKDEALICLGDCVGHGVAGSLLSSLYTTYLNKISKITIDPESLINSLDREIKHLMSQSNNPAEEFTCELGIILINKETMSLKFAGSNTELFVIGDSIDTIKSDRFSVGSSFVQEALNTQEIKFEPDSWIMMASDGFKNMFNKDNERLSAKGVKKLLQRTKNRDGGEYAEKLQKEIDSYLEEATRNDDIFILGVKC